MTCPRHGEDESRSMREEDEETGKRKLFWLRQQTASHLLSPNDSSKKKYRKNCIALSERQYMVWDKHCESTQSV
jgi:hypothetical protein